jgi:preprotein translocase subunit SecA
MLEFVSLEIPYIMSFLSKIFGDSNSRFISGLYSVVDQINTLEPEYQKLTDDQLKAKTSEFKSRLAKGETLDDILPEAFAAVREASRRNSGLRHFDVQLMGGMILHQGKIAEMRTGEGKTLVATLPAYLNALTGKGVHVVTVNDYLSRRDAVWTGQIYAALGLSVGAINHDGSYLYDPTHQNPSDPLDKERDATASFRVIHEFLRPVERAEAYQADITYGTNNEYGFDYLRDNLVYSKEQMVQRPHHFAIVDEVDSILIDEARTPLIISAPDSESGELYQTFARAVPHLKEGDDYTVDEKLKTVSITESGIEKIEQRLGMQNLYDEGGVRYVHHLEQALKAHVLFKRDKDYVVKEGEVIIVDEFTGRMMPGRRWSEGLHQAVEAKEGVKIEKESRTLATITFQNYFRLYEKLSGMTGTAKTSAEEFHKVYHLDVATVPTNKPMVRVDSPDRIYKTEMGKYRAIAREVKERHEKGQPVLIGTVSIQKNELLSTILEQEGIPHNTLNAKNHEKEAEFIAQAGRHGAVTVATNMAGRGVDIILGGNPPEAEDGAKVRAAGGLHVIGTERHEARRIDDQLRGRAGRQGDPGSSQFFVSTEDDVIRVFGGDRLKNVMNTLGISEDDVIENRFISNAIAQAQTRIEGHHFDSRKYVLEYDDVMNKHRTAVYKVRKEALFTDNAKDMILGYITEQIEGIVRAHMVSESGQPDTKEMIEALKGMYLLSSESESKIRESAEKGDEEATISMALESAMQAYEAREKDMGTETTRNIEKAVILRTVDEIWMDHIEAMEHLRDSVRLRAYGQRDPLIEYKLEGQQMFERLLGTIKAQIANMIFKVSPAQQQQTQKTIIEERGALDISAPEVTGGTHSETLPGKSIKQESHPELGRNDPCYCGSGKKYKKCHGA